MMTDVQMTITSWKGKRVTDSYLEARMFGETFTGEYDFRV